MDKLTSSIIHIKQTDVNKTWKCLIQSKR